MQLPADIQFAFLATLVLFISLGTSQQSGLPQCAKNCTQELTLSSCASTDFACVCNSTVYVNAIASCINELCTAPGDGDRTAAYFIKLCAAVNVTLNLGPYTATSIVSGRTYTQTATLGTSLTTTTSSSVTRSSSSESSTSTSGTVASATSSGPVATVTALIHKKSNPGKIAGIVIGSLAGLALIAAAAFNFGRRGHRRQAQEKSSGAEAATEPSHLSDEPKGPVELGSTVVSPTSTRHEMESPMIARHLNTGLSELPDASQPAVELPAEPVRYEK